MGRSPLIRTLHTKMIYLLFIVYRTDKANIIDCAGIKSTEVVKPVLGAERFGLVDTCDSAILIQHGSREALRKKLKTH